MNGDIKKLLIGEKRKKILISKSVIDELKKIKKEYSGNLDICEMVECCFDNFDFSSQSQKKSDCHIFEKFAQKDDSVQLRIRSDIYEKLKNIQKISQRPVREIITLIVRLTLTN